MGVLLALLLGGCTLVGKAWERPVLPSPAAWSLPLPAAEEATAEGNFWSAWGDSRLVEWIQRAVLENREMRLAVARIAEARALTRGAAAGEQPTVDLGGSVARDRASEENRMPMRGIPNPVTLYQAGFDAHWEWDLFGRISHQKEAAEAEWLAANRMQSALQISLSAEVAATYCDWRAAQAKGEALHRQAEASRALLDMVRSRLHAGLNSELDLRRAEDQLAQTEARLPAVQAALGLAMRRLGVLTGGQADSLLAEISAGGSLPVMVPALPSVVPAALLDRRPDLLAAEARAHAAQARIGAAEGEQWPHLSLAATLGTLSIASGGLLSSGSSLYNVGPQLSLPLLHGGALEAEVDAARARAEQAVLAWEKAAAEAILEVETAALRQREAKERYEFLSKSLVAQRQALDLATVRYQRGMSDFTVPLEATRQWAAMEIEVIEAHLHLLTSGIALYKALGGGWTGK